MTIKKLLPMKRKLLANLEAGISELKNMNVKVVVGPRYNIIHMNKKTMMEIEQMEKMEKFVMKLKFKLHNKCSTWLQLCSRIPILYRNNDASLGLSSGINAKKPLLICSFVTKCKPRTCSLISNK